MTDDPDLLAVAGNAATPQPPEAVRKIVTAMVDQALARCDREGIDWADFLAAMGAEGELMAGRGTFTELFDRTFRRLAAGAN